MARGPAWTDDERAFLVANYKRLGPSICKHLPGRSEGACMTEASKLGVAKRRPRMKIDKENRLKECSGCGFMKPFKDFYFHARKTVRFSSCKNCYGTSVKEKQAKKRLDQPHVYFLIEDTGQRGAIKIGKYSSGLRLSGLQAGNSRPLKIILSFPGAEAKERGLHDKFAHLRIYLYNDKKRPTEWFEPGPDLLAWIDQTKREINYETVG